MNQIRRYFVFIPIVALALILAACDTATDDTDDTGDVETPDTTTDVTDDATTDDAVVEEDTTDTTTPEASEETPADTETEVTPTEDIDETAVTEESEETPADTNGEETGDNDAEQILEQAAERASDLETAQFELDGSGYIELDEIGEVSLNDAEGQVERPDRAHISIAVDAAIAEIPIELLSYDGEIYFTDPVSGEWHSVPDDFQFNPGILFDEDEGLPALIRSVEDPELLDTEEIEGREAYKIYGLISQETINAGTGGVFQAEGDVDFNVWIDTETYDVLRVLAEDPTEETDSVWEMRIFGHDEPVEIDSPN